jgi:hypothetical protein
MRTVANPNHRTSLHRSVTDSRNYKHHRQYNTTAHSPGKKHAHTLVPGALHLAGLILRAEDRDTNEDERDGEGRNEINLDVVHLGLHLDRRLAASAFL